MSFEKLLPLLQEKKEIALSDDKKWKKVGKDSPIVLMPCSYNAGEVVKVLLSDGFNICKICDNNSNLHGEVIEGIGVAPVEYIGNIQSDNKIIVISKSPKVFESLSQQVMSLGISKCRIYNFYDMLNSVSDRLRRDLHYPYLRFHNSELNQIDKKEIEAAAPTIMQVMNFMSDELSKSVLLHVLAARSFEDFRIVSSVIEDNQYFPDFFPIRENEVFVDAGAYDGDSARDFIKHASAVSDYIIHCFEPNPPVYLKLAESMKANRHVVCHKLGLGSAEEVTKFTSGSTRGGRIDNKGDVEVQITSGDILGIKPTWIKADVEGSEMALLKGFQNTIKKYKPRLSICVYHNSYDLWEIPVYIKSLVPEYRLFLRHHFMNIWESVLHAAVDGDYSL